MQGVEGGDRRFWGLLGAIVLLGLGLRIAGAQGALWLDEAWSAKQAHDAGTALGVFLNINHDNNHHLNSLWLLSVGFDAPPLLSRALAIVTGTAAIPVAALIGARRGAVPGLVTALLFAVSPMLVTFGSEARGYAPAALALLVAVLLVDRRLAGEDTRPALALALCFFLGALSQLIAFVGFCALTGWAFLALWRQSGLRPAIVETVRLFLPAAIALGLVAAIVVGAAAAHTGFKFGRYEAYDTLALFRGMAAMVQYTLAFPVSSIWWSAAVPALVLLGVAAGASRIALHGLAMLAFPLTLALFRLGNVGHPRYYLVLGIAMLILVAETIGIGLRAGGWKRRLAAASLAAIALASLVLDVDLAIDRRGDVGSAIRAMRSRSPSGAQLVLESESGLATLEAASASARYPLQIDMAPCASARFRFADSYRPDEDPPAIERCGARYVPVLDVKAHGMSGTHWTLYERQP